MQLIELFKVPLFVALLDLDTTAIEEYCLDYREKANETWDRTDNETRLVDSRILSNIGGFQSKDVVIYPLVEEIDKYLIAFSEQLAIDGELVVLNMWININEFKDYNKSHAHPNALFAGVYYVKTPDKCGNIMFESPSHDVMQHTYHATKFKGYNLFNSVTHWQEAKENILYVFPGWLKHRVEPNLSEEKRISISFNIGLR